jgi:adenylate cyclase
MGDREPDPRFVTGPHVGRVAAARLTVGSILANVISAAIVFATAAWALPSPRVTHDAAHLLILNVIMTGAYLLLAVPIGIVYGVRVARRSSRFLFEQRPPTEAEVAGVVRLPLRVTAVQAVLWGVAAILFTLVNGLLDPALIPRVGFTVVLGGVTTCAVTYLLCERSIRPVAALAMSVGAPRLPRVPGVTMRFFLAWSLGTGIPVLGLLIAAIFGLADSRATKVQFGVTMLVLGSVALIVGLGAVLLTARAIGDPVRSVAQGLRQVEAGDYDAEVPVYDASELGRLQLGFNRMAAGLKERERLRDLFGRHVGEEVARDALARGVDLGGEEREVGVLFVDIIGSTALASAESPAHVVEVLNRFFTVVIDVIDRHHGQINKFEGDAALALFGAPRPLDHAADHLLAAARELSCRLPAEAPEARAGIGVSYGIVVAGNVGAAERFEYTAIGDPVNEAARLTEAAKATPGLVLASGAALDAASETEASHWERGESMVLRGRSEATVTAHLRPA